MADNGAAATKSERKPAAAAPAKEDTKAAAKEGTTPLAKAAAPPSTPQAEQLTRDDFVKARNCLLLVAVVVVAGIAAIGWGSSSPSVFVKFPPAIIEQMRDGMFVPVATGVTMFARMEGPRAEHVLLIHGSFGASFGWRKVIPYLRNVHSLRVVSFDLVGFGLSDKPKDAPYTMQQLADQVRDLLLFMQVPPVHVVAHDLGVDVALLFAARNANWVRSLTLLNPARSVVHQPGFLSTPLAWLPHLQAKYAVWSSMQTSSISSSDTDSYTFLLAYKNGFASYAKAVKNANGISAISDDALSQLKPIPTQLVWGTLGLDTAELAKAKKIFAPKHIIELPVSHYVQEDAAERVAQSVATFIAELPATPLPPEEAPRPPVYSDPMGGHGHSHGGHGHSHGGGGGEHNHADMVIEEEDHAHSHGGNGHGHSHGGHGHAH